MKNLALAFILALVPTFSFACPPTEGDYEANIVINKEIVGTITNSVHFNSPSSIRVQLDNSLSLGARGATSIRFEDEITFTGLLRPYENEFIIANRYVEPGEVISFNIKNKKTSSQVNVQFVNGIDGSRPKGLGCGGPLAPVEVKKSK